MALRRRSAQRVSGNIWPGFVDAMTALLLVLMFVLTIFMMVMFLFRETIDGQETELNDLTSEITALSQTLGLEQQRGFQLEEQVDSLGTSLEQARQKADVQAALIASLNSHVAEQTQELTARASAISSFEAQVATLLSERDTARAKGADLAENVAELEAERTRLLTDQEALNLALAQARDEISAQDETARLAAARRQALDALISDLHSRAEQGKASLAQVLADLQTSRDQASVLRETVSELENTLSEREANQLAEAAAAEALRVRLSETQVSLSEEEKRRLADAAAAEQLRKRLKDADDELTAMTLALEEQRRKAEETLTLLAAANVAQKDLDVRLLAALQTEEELRQAADETQAEMAALRGNLGDDQALQKQLAAALAAKLAAEQQLTTRLSDAETRAVLLATANDALAQEEAKSAEGLRKLAVLNEQVAALRGQLGALQALLDDAEAQDQAARVEITNLGSRLNTALAQVASEERQRAKLEESERRRLEEEARQLARYRSEFFGKLRDVLGNHEGVKIVGDRFVFSSEVLFEPASADLAPEGKSQISRVAGILQDVSGQIPPEIDWIIRVDGHTDNTPLSGLGRYRDNWELSQARALSVVRYMTDDLGFPAQRLAATGFGEFQPVASGDSPEALAQNRRIELKLTER